MKKATASKSPSVGKAKPPRRKSRGALAAICALLITSGLLRLAIGASEAIARENGTPDLKPEATPVAAPADAPLPSEQASTIPKGFKDGQLQAVLDALSAREERVAKREREVAIRMQAMKVAETQVELRLKELIAAEETLRSTITLARTAAEDDVARLTDVYANMKPKKAAALFEEMDPEFAAGFLARMRPDAAAAIMAGMSPQAAYLTSVILAGRNADAPKDSPPKPKNE